MRVRTDPPIEGAEILLDGVSVGFTGTDGTLSITGVTAGSHTIEARKEGYTPDSATISVPETTSVTLTLTPLKFSISGSIWDAKTGAALNAFEAVLVLDGVVTPAWRSGNSFQIVDVPSGYHTLVVRYSGYGDWPWEGDVARDISLDVRLTPLIYTVVVTVTGSQISGASIYLDGSYVGATDAAGRLTIPNVTAGSHTIRASKSGYYDASKTISVPETTSVTLTLTPIPKIRTEVRLSSDKTSYTVGERAYLTQGLYDEAGGLISGRVVDYTVTLDGAWYVGWGQYSDDPSRTLILNKAGTYVITGVFAGDDTYEPSYKTITITATVAPPPDFSISVSPTSGLVEQGQFTSTTVFVTGYGGFSSTVNLSVSGLPSGASVVFSKSSGIPDFQSGLRISTSSTTPTGTYVITVIGYGGGLTRTCTYTLTVTAPPPPPPTGYLYGYVVNAYTGYLIPGATVTCAGKSTTSDFSGYYMLTDLPTGAQTLTASASGYRPYSESITILAGPNYKYIGMIRV